jgi:hypothetical protein
MHMTLEYSKYTRVFGNSQYVDCLVLGLFSFSLTLKKVRLNWEYLVSGFNSNQKPYIEGEKKILLDNKAS